MTAKASTLQIPNIGDSVLVIFATALFLATLTSLLNYAPRSATSVGDLEAVGTIQTTSFVRRRHGGTLAWEEISNQKPIYLRDLVYTPPNAQAQVQLKDGRWVTLPPDSLVQFDEITVSNLEITLRELQEPKRKLFRLVPLPKTQTAGTLEDPMPLELDYASAVERFLQHPYSKLPSKARPVETPAFVWRLEDYEIELRAPVDGQTLGYGPHLWTAVAWSPIPIRDAQYRVEVSTKADFKKKLSFLAKKNQLEIQFEKPGKYFWRVTAISDGRTLSSAVQTFNLVPTQNRSTSRRSHP